jgi:uncharacterized protein YaiI (UPF0178 family)
MTTTLYIDADACPVKEEAVRVAERHGTPLCPRLQNAQNCASLST